MTDYGLGRVAAFDERSRNFPVMAVVSAPTPRSYTWSLPIVLDQGPEPECVGFSWAGELAARPVEVPVGNPTGRSLYRDAQTIDRAEGRHWPAGASVLAGAKAVRNRGWMPEYRWAFGVEDLAVGVSRKGPAVIGVDWHSGMFNVGGDGYIRPTGEVVGGHAIVVRGYNVQARRFLLHNSWGPGWGRNGTAYISYDDLGALLANRGDACIPMLRTKG